jgi:hypothetical protein
MCSIVVTSWRRWTLGYALLSCYTALAAIPRAALLKQFSPSFSATSFSGFNVQDAFSVGLVMIVASSCAKCGRSQVGNGVIAATVDVTGSQVRVAP